MRILIQNKFNKELIEKNNYPFFERLFYRKISRIITLKLAKTKISPTSVNILGFLIGIGGLLLVAFGSYWLRITGGIILIFSYILDCTDGELARGYKIQDKFGALLDTTLDSIKESLIMFALGYAYYLQTHNEQIEIYLVIILFSQRMFGRTLAWFRLLYEEDVKIIRDKAIDNIPKILKPAMLFFSEAYRSGTIWLVALIGIITNQIIPTLIYFIVVILALFLFLIFQSYRHHQKNNK